MQFRALISLLLCGVIGIAQNPELGRVERRGDEATLMVDGPRPVDSAAMTLAKEFGIRVNVEDPTYLFDEDVKDVTDAVRRGPANGRRVLIPKGGRLEVRFAVGTDGRPADVPGLLRSLVDAANLQFPFRYRLEADGDWYSLVPTHTRDINGRSISITPLLDRPVNIPAGKRTVAETAGLMAIDLSRQTGLKVNCCQAGVAGIPWGMEQVSLESNGEPARKVLQRLIRTTGARTHWLQRCDPGTSGWCFINLAYIVGQDPPRVNNPEARIDGLPKWFEPVPRKP